MKLTIIEIPISDIFPYDNNPRNNNSAVLAVKKSIDEYGFQNPIIVDKDHVIIAGHTRYTAATQLGYKQLPCIVIDDLSDEKIKAFRLADNKVSEFSQWDYEKLNKELIGLDDDSWVASLFKKLEEKTAEYESKEMNLEDFGDEAFQYECPCCGFKFNA